MPIKLLCTLAVVGLSLAAGAAVGQVELYEKHDLLQQTMLATRARLTAWQASQCDARGAVRVGQWRSTVIGSGQPLDPERITQDGIEKAAGKQHQPAWRECPTDGSRQPILAAGSADFLYATLVADRPVAITIELSRHEPFGGFAYRPPPPRAGVRPTDGLLWVNGHRVPLCDRLAGYNRVPVAKRRGWHDAVLVDVPLVRGENRLLVALGKGSERAWFNAVRLAPDPLPALWSMIENDFPRRENRLLDAIPHPWFDAAGGWFAEAAGKGGQEGKGGQSPFRTKGDCPPFPAPFPARLEQQFVAAMADELGPDGAAIRGPVAKLAAARVSSSEPRWLDLCVTAAELRGALHDVDALRAAVKELHAAYPDRYNGPALLARAAELRGRLCRQAAEGLAPPSRLFEELRRLQRLALVEENPLLRGKTLLCVKRHTYDSNHYYDEFIAGLRRFGGNLCLLSLADGKLREIAPQLEGGIFDRYDLSFDAKRIVFDYKPHKPEGFRIYEIGVDGAGLRQLTFPPAAEPKRIAAYSEFSPEQLQQDPGRYGHWTDDMHPCYLPDGRIVFTSTRNEHGVLCGGHSLTATNLFRIDADGSHLRPLSQGALSEFCPTLLNDGRILYNRWEYVDKGAGAVQLLWTMCPDGSRSEAIYGANIGMPAVLNQARQVPGRNDLIVCLGSGHSPGNVGAILLIDWHKSKESPEAMTALTPGSLPKGNWGLRQLRNGRWLVDVYGPWYCDPSPLADPARSGLAGKFFLVSCNPDKLWNDPAGFGIDLLDVFGNRVPIYADPDISCFQARVFEPRKSPPAIPDAPPPDGPDAERATVVVSDVYQGLDGVAPGTVKYLRVMEQVPRPWSAHCGCPGNDSSPGQMVAISLYTHLSVKVEHGIVPVREDGSACFTVPARRNIFLQALDGDFLEIQRMRTFVNFQPGERRSCIGCHEHRNLAPANRRPLCLNFPPVALAPQPGETVPRPVHYATDVQPIFDRHCVSCHSAKRAEGHLDLGGELTTLFCRSYENIIQKDLVGYIQEFIGPKPEGVDGMGYGPAVPPYTYGSHRSKLMAVLRNGHYGVRLPREDFIRLATWVDANAPYYGSYFGRRNLEYRDRPDFRPVPTLQSAWGISPSPP
jgi:hypothetical protein